jgi:hypothetical protein
MARAWKGRIRYDDTDIKDYSKSTFIVPTPRKLPSRLSRGAQHAISWDG